LDPEIPIDSTTYHNKNGVLMDQSFMFHRFTITSVERNLGFAIQETPKHEHHWLVVEPYPSEKSWSSSVGMMTFPIYGKS
jgi:hypothetical protein